MRSPTYIRFVGVVPESARMSLRPQVKGPDLAPSPAIYRRLIRASRSTRRLTPREREVIYWVSEGKRDREIAVILGLSPRTVEKHVGHILEKLGVETRTAAVNECRYAPALVRTAVNAKQQRDQM